MHTLLIFNCVDIYTCITIHNHNTVHVAIHTATVKNVMQMNESDIALVVTEDRLNMESAKLL